MKIPVSIFGGKELGHGNLARGVVQEAEQSKLWAAMFEPAMKTAIEEEHFAFASATQTAERLPAERNTFDLAKLLTEMMIVKTNIAGAGQMQDPVPHARRKAVRA